MSDAYLHQLRTVLHAAGDAAWIEKADARLGAYDDLPSIVGI